MKKYYLFILLLSISIFSCRRDDIGDNSDPLSIIDSTIKKEHSYEDIFDISTISEIKITINPGDWNKLLHYFDLNPHNEECVPANFMFSCGDKKFVKDSVGFRIRGNTSRRRPEGSHSEEHKTIGADWHHASFGIKFKEYVKGSFWGADRLNLKWFKDDPAYCREVFCYNLFRDFGVWTSPRATYTRLTIHIAGDEIPAYFGVYALIEGINDGFLENRVKDSLLKSDKGNLWKASWGATFNNSNTSSMGVEDVTLDPSTSKNYTYDLKTNKKKGLEDATAQLVNFISELGSKPNGSAQLENFLERKMDVSLFLKTYAVNVIVGMWDDYWCNCNNFYFYFDTDNKFYFIPYDYDNTLGTSSIINSGTQDPLKWGPVDDTRRLIYKILSIDKYKQQYIAFLNELIDTNNNLFTYRASLLRIKKWHQMISPYVSNDTGEDMVIEDKPASWGNVEKYRLFTGNDKGGEEGEANFFKTKVASIPKKQ